MLSRHCAIGLVFVALLAVWANPAHAAINEIQRLYFGKWYFPPNNSVETITVTTGGTVNTTSPALIMMESPRPGIYSVTGLPPFTVINNVTVTMNQPMENGALFVDMDNFTTQIPNADGAGVTTLRIGGDALTSGNGQGYTGGAYNGQIDIVIDF